MDFSNEDIPKILDGLRLKCTVQVPRLSVQKIESYIQKKSHTTPRKRKQFKRLRLIPPDTDDDDVCSDSRLSSFSVNDNYSFSSSVVLKPLPINVIKDTCDESIELKKNIPLKRKHVHQEINVPKEVKFVQSKTDSDNIDNDVTDSFQIAECVHNKVTVKYNLRSEKSDENKSLPNHIKSNITNTKLTDVSNVKVKLDDITEINSKRKCKGEQINYPKNKVNANKNKIQEIIMPEITNSDGNIKIKTANSLCKKELTRKIQRTDCNELKTQLNNGNSKKRGDVRSQKSIPQISKSHNANSPKQSFGNRNSMDIHLNVSGKTELEVLKMLSKKTNITIEPRKSSEIKRNLLNRGVNNTLKHQVSENTSFIDMVNNHHSNSNDNGKHRNSISNIVSTETINSNNQIVNNNVGGNQITTADGSRSKLKTSGVQLLDNNGHIQYSQDSTINNVKCSLKTDKLSSCNVHATDSNENCRTTRKRVKTHEKYEKHVSDKIKVVCSENLGKSKSMQNSNINQIDNTKTSQIQSKTGSVNGKEIFDHIDKSSIEVVKSTVVPENIAKSRNNQIVNNDVGGNQITTADGSRSKLKTSGVQLLDNNGHIQYSQDSTINNVKCSLKTDKLSSCNVHATDSNENCRTTRKRVKTHEKYEKHVSDKIKVVCSENLGKSKSMQNSNINQIDNTKTSQIQSKTGSVNGKEIFDHIDKSSIEVVKSTVVPENIAKSRNNQIVNNDVGGNQITTADGSRSKLKTSGVQLLDNNGHIQYSQDSTINNVKCSLKTDKLSSCNVHTTDSNENCRTTRKRVKTHEKYEKHVSDKIKVVCSENLDKSKSMQNSNINQIDNTKTSRIQSKTGSVNGKEIFDHIDKSSIEVVKSTVVPQNIAKSRNNQIVNNDVGGNQITTADGSRSKLKTCGVQLLDNNGHIQYSQDSTINNVKCSLKTDKLSSCNVHATDSNENCRTTKKRVKTHEKYEKHVSDKIKVVCSENLGKSKSMQNSNINQIDNTKTSQIQSKTGSVNGKEIFDHIDKSSIEVVKSTVVPENIAKSRNNQIVNNDVGGNQITTADGSRSKLKTSGVQLLDNNGHIQYSQDSTINNVKCSLKTDKLSSCNVHTTDSNENCRTTRKRVKTHEKYEKHVSDKIKVVCSENLDKSKSMQNSNINQIDNTKTSRIQSKTGSVNGKEIFDHIDKSSIEVVKSTVVPQNIAKSRNNQIVNNDVGGNQITTADGSRSKLKTCGVQLLDNNGHIQCSQDSTINNVKCSLKTDKLSSCNVHATDSNENCRTTKKRVKTHEKYEKHVSDKIKVVCSENLGKSKSMQNSNINQIDNTKTSQIQSKTGSVNGKEIFDHIDKSSIEVVKSTVVPENIAKSRNNQIVNNDVGGNQITTADGSRSKLKTSGVQLLDNNGHIQYSQDSTINNVKCSLKTDKLSSCNVHTTDSNENCRTTRKRVKTHEKYEKHVSDKIKVVCSENLDKSKSMQNSNINQIDNTKTSQIQSKTGSVNGKEIFDHIDKSSIEVVKSTVVPENIAKSRNNQIVNNDVGGNQITTADGSRSKLKTSGVQLLDNNGHIQYSQDSTINNVKCSLKTDKLSSCNVHTTDSNENCRTTRKRVKTHEKYEKHVSDKIKVVCSENLDKSKSMQNSNINQIDNTKTSRIQSKTGSVNGKEIFDHIDKSSIEVVKSTVVPQNIAKSRNNQIVNNDVGGNQITTADGSRSKLKTCGVQLLDNNGHIQCSQDSTINNVKCSLKTDKLSSCNVHATDSNENCRTTRKRVKTHEKYEKHVSDKIKVVCSENLDKSKSIQNSNINQIDNTKTSRIQSKTGSVNGKEIFDHIDKSSIEVVKSTVVPENIAKSRNNQIVNNDVGGNQITTADGSRSKLKTSGVQLLDNNGHIQYSQDSTINNVKCSLKTDKLSSCNVHTTDSNENCRTTRKRVKTHEKYEKHVSDKIKVVCSENLDKSKSMQNSNINQIDNTKTSRIQSKTGSVNGKEIFDHIDKSSIEVVKSTVVPQNIAKSRNNQIVNNDVGGNQITTADGSRSKLKTCGVQLLDNNGHIQYGQDSQIVNNNINSTTVTNFVNTKENTVETPRKNSIYENKDMVGRIWVKSTFKLTGENSSSSGKNEAEHCNAAGCSQISNVNVPQTVTKIFTCNQEVSISVPSIIKKSPAKRSRNSKNRSSPLSKCENAYVDLDGMLVASTSSQSNRNTNIISSESKANGETVPDTISTNQTLPHSGLVSGDSIQLIQPFVSNSIVNSLNNPLKNPSKNTTVLIGTSLFSTDGVNELFEKYIKSENQSSIKLIVGILSAIIDIGNSKQNHETKNKANITLFRKSLTKHFFNVIDSFEEKHFNVLVCLLFLYMFLLLTTTCCKLGNNRNGLNGLISLLKDNLFHKGHDNHFRVESILTSKTLHRDCLSLIKVLSSNLPADGTVRNVNKYINDSSNGSLKNKGTLFSKAAGKNNLLLHESKSMSVSSLSSSSLPTTSTGSSPSLMPSLNNLTTPERLKDATECDKSTGMKTTYNNKKPIIVANANVSTGNLIFKSPSKLESTKRTLENKIIESNLQDLTLDATTNNRPHGSRLTTPIMTSAIEPVSNNPFLCNSKNDNQVQLVGNSGVANVPHTISNNNTTNGFHSVVKPSDQYVSSYSDSPELQFLDQLLQPKIHPINQTSKLDCNNANNYSSVIGNNWSTDQHLQLHEQNFTDSVYQLNPQNEGINVITRSDDTRYLPEYTTAVHQPELQPPPFMNGNSQQDRLNNVTQNIINKQQAYSNNSNFDLFGQTPGNIYVPDISQPAVLQSQYRQTEFPNTTCVLNQQQNLSQILNSGICGQYSEINNIQRTVNITNNVSQQLNVYNNVQSGDKSVHTERANFVNHVTHAGNNVNLNAVSQTMTETNNTKSNAGKCIVPLSNYSNSNHIVYDSNRLNSTLQPNGENCFPQITSYNTSGTNYNVSATTVAAGNTCDVNPLTGNNISAANIDGMDQLSTTTNFTAYPETASLCFADGCRRVSEVVGSCCYLVNYCGTDCQYKDWPEHCMICPGPGPEDFSR